MPSPFQQQSQQRKLIYLAIIVVLFGLTVLLRRQSSYGLEVQGERLGVREQDQGEVELTGSAIRLSLTGTRGPAVCYLWMMAIEKQKLHEWNKLELLVRSLIKLQPHFVTPWLFQSWNLSYNVSVEFDRVKDKYFYVTRGINLLGAGERQNKNNPDMRFAMGMYIQNKMGVSDETNTMRSLFQMSCIDPVERNPARFRRMVRGRPVIDFGRFEEFCSRHPFMVRRLRDSLRYKTPDEIIDFLEANKNIPGLFETPLDLAPDAEQRKTPYKTEEERFPILPAKASDFDPNEITPGSPLIEQDDFDNYIAARVWFGYAQDPLPEQRPHMTVVIFQGYPARAQAHNAERLEKEGWFDREGWEIPDWFPLDKTRPEGSKKPIRVGTANNWAKDSWDKAYQMYRRHGLEHDLLKTDEEIKTMTPRQRMDYNYYRMLTNYGHFQYATAVERTDDAIRAHKVLYQADQLRRTGRRARALELYESADAFGTPEQWAKGKAVGWKKILVSNPEYGMDEELQEETYINQERYLRLIRDLRGPGLRQQLVEASVAQTGLAPTTVTWWIPVHVLIGLKGPGDDVNKDGQPLITLTSKNRIRQRFGLPTLTPAGEGTKPGTGGMPPGMRPGGRPPMDRPPR